MHRKHVSFLLDAVTAHRLVQSTPTMWPLIKNSISTAMEICRHRKKDQQQRQQHNKRVLDAVQFQWIYFIHKDGLSHWTLHVTKREKQSSNYTHTHTPTIQHKPRIRTFFFWIECASVWSILPRRPFFFYRENSKIVSRCHIHCLNDEFRYHSAIFVVVFHVYDIWLVRSLLIHVAKEPQPGTYVRT